MKGACRSNLGIARIPSVTENLQAVGLPVVRASNSFKLCCHHLLYGTLVRLWRLVCMSARLLEHNNNHHLKVGGQPVPVVVFAFHEKTATNDATLRLEGCCRHDLCPRGGANRDVGTNGQSFGGVRLPS